MGSVIGKTMEESFNKQQDFMLKTQQLAMERQLAMQNEMRERQTAFMIARSRDFFQYWGTFYCVAAFGLTMGAMKRKNYSLLVPLIPLSFVTTFHWDMAYGPKLVRLREMAERIIDEEHDLLTLPHGMPTFDNVEAARLKSKSNEPYKPGHDIFL